MLLFRSRADPRQDPLLGPLLAELDALTTQQPYRPAQAPPLPIYRRNSVPYEAATLPRASDSQTRSNYGKIRIENGDETVGILCFVRPMTTVLLCINRLYSTGANVLFCPEQGYECFVRQTSSLVFSISNRFHTNDTSNILFFWVSLTVMPKQKREGEKENEEDFLAETRLISFPLSLSLLLRSVVSFLHFERKTNFNANRAAKWY